MSEPDGEPAPDLEGAPESKLGMGSVLAAIFLGFLGFVSLLSTGCFGLFAFGRGSVDGVLVFGMLIMAGVTLGFAQWSRAVLKRGRRKNLLLRATARPVELKEGSDHE